MFTQADVCCVVFRLCCVVIAVVNTFPLFAQCDSAQSIKEYADSAEIGGVKHARAIFFPGAEPKTGTMINMQHVMPVWRFSLSYPSLHSDIVWTFTEFARNGSKLGLKYWCNNQEIAQWQAQQLSAQTRTFDMLLRPGDTISFFRRFLYSVMMNNAKRVVYAALDDLAWSVVLNDALTHQPLVVLDSLYAGRNVNPSKAMVFRGYHPLVSEVRYRLPDNLFGNDTARYCYVQVNVCKHGSSSALFRRTDFVHAGLLSKQQVPSADGMVNSKPSSKLAVYQEQARRAQELYQRAITTRFIPSSGLVQVSLEPSLLNTLPHSEYSIGVYTAQGLMVAHWLVEKPERSVVLEYHAQQSGVYFVTVMANNRTVFHEQVIVKR